jgi:hypothetical protein
VITARIAHGEFIHWPDRDAQPPHCVNSIVDLDGFAADVDFIL